MSKIEWTQRTWNPVTGCTRVSAGCDNCYAVGMTKRLEAMGLEKYQGLVNPGKSHFNGVVKCHEDELEKPLHWKKPRRIFVNSMSDLFHAAVPFEFIDKVFAVMALRPQHTFQILTKRPGRMAEYFMAIGGTVRRDWVRMAADKIQPGSAFPNWPLPNVWLGTSVENQDAADERIPHLLRCPAAVRFLSCEPLLGPITFRWARWHDYKTQMDIRRTDSSDVLASEYDGIDGIHWIICGGESGHRARPMDIRWVRDIIAQCKAAAVAVFVKQLGAFIELPSGWRGALNSPKGGDMDEWPEDLRIREYPS